MVFYRKYRPQTIHELDSEAVREQLYAVLSKPEVAHAFLFTGPKGLGKTSTARIVAKVVNCERLVNQSLELRKKGKKRKKEYLDTSAHDSSFMIHDSRDIEPCNQCSQCVSITNGTNLDVLEIDGASNRGIDEIRDLREKIKLSPVAARKKVYIIDEVHMLTTEAFNALLKTLEEPPAHVMFILCTTEPHKVPATIASRCFHIPFERARTDELERSFQKIADGEKLQVDKEVLHYIARLSDGGFRDGAKILEELALLGKGKKITKELVETKYQVASSMYYVASMVESLAQKDTKKSLEIVQTLIKQGIDMKFFVEQSINLLHGLLLSKLGIEPEVELKIKNEKLKIEEIKKLIDLLSRAHRELKYAVLPQLPLELAVIEWGVNESRTPKEVKNSSMGESSTFSSLAGGQPNSSNNSKLWYQFIDAVKVQNHSIAGVLRGCSLKEFNGTKVTIAAKYKFHKDKLEEQETHELLEKVWEEMSGNKVQVRVELTNK